MSATRFNQLPFLLWQVLTKLGHLRLSAVRDVVRRQLLFSGLQALPAIIIIGALFGFSIAHLLHNEYGQSRDTVLRWLSVMALQEVGPLFTALILTARSASAIAIELSGMQQHGEIRFLDRVGISTSAYLVLPRVVAMALAGLLLSVYFAAAAMFAGLVFTAPQNVLYDVVWLPEIMSLSQIAWLCGKGFILGLVVGCYACLGGLRYGSLILDTPRAASFAVMRSIVAIFAIDALMILAAAW